MLTQTSIDSYYSELVAGNVGRRRRQVLDYAISRHAFGTPDFTRADIKSHFGDSCDSFVPRCRELCDMGLLEISGVAKNEQTGKTNNTWRATEQALSGKGPAAFLRRATRATNAKMVDDLIAILLEADRSEDKAARIEQLRAGIISRMRSGIIRLPKAEACK